MSPGLISAHKSGCDSRGIILQVTCCRGSRVSVDERIGSVVAAVGSRRAPRRELRKPPAGRDKDGGFPLDARNREWRQEVTEGYF
jgi:hypothetical protein